MVNDKQELLDELRRSKNHLQQCYITDKSVENCRMMNNTDKTLKKPIKYGYAVVALLLVIVAFGIQQTYYRMVTIPRAQRLHQGPWPDCVGMTGSKCQKMIETYAEDVRGNVYIVPPKSIIHMDYRTNRVHIFVDSNNIVTKIPQRG